MATPNRTYLSNGQVLDSPPLTARVSRAADGVYNFLGLYFVSLFSLDPFAAAQNSQFNTSNRPESYQTRARWTSSAAPRTSTADASTTRPGGSGSRGGGSGGGSSDAPRRRPMGTLDQLRLSDGSVVMDNIYNLSFNIGNRTVDPVRGIRLDTDTNYDTPMHDDAFLITNTGQVPTRVGNQMLQPGRSMHFMEVFAYNSPPHRREIIHYLEDHFEHVAQLVAQATPAELAYVLGRLQIITHSWAYQAFTVTQNPDNTWSVRSYGNVNRG